MPAAPPTSPPPSPIPAPVSLEELNTLETFGVVHRHIWQEFHWKAPADKYRGKTEVDRRVVERLDEESTRIGKKKLNSAFCEWAVATVDVEVPDGQKLYMRWWLEDAEGKRVLEHPDFNKANVEGFKDAARISTGNYGWRWDGRLPNQAKRPVFLQNATGHSRIEIRTASGRVIPLGTIDRAEIEVQGRPYRVFIVATPKTNLELEAERQARCGGRWLSSRGNRFQADCWIRIFRGVKSDGNDDFAVFLGQGAVEATDVQTATEAGTAARWGAIATPHDADLKGYIRQGKHGGVQFWLFEIVDPAPASAAVSALIPLETRSGPDGLLPPPNNPFCDTQPNKPYKDGVHGHQSFRDGGSSAVHAFVSEPASVGCTTFLNLSSGAVEGTTGIRGDLRSVRSEFGSWNGSVPSATGTALWGPPLGDGRPGTFRNKQNKRNETRDALLADDHDQPLLKSPAVAGEESGIESPHMQATVQHAVLGGFLEHEIPSKSSVAADPDDSAFDKDPKVWIRVRLEQGGEGGLYWAYHRLVCFGHTMKLDGDTVGAELWIPRMVQRLWNGHWRNLQVGGTTDYRWYFERRNPNGASTIVGWIGVKPSANDGWVPLVPANMGKFAKSLPRPTPLKVTTSDVGDVYAVFQYRIRLHPAPGAATSVWQPLAAMDDPFVSVLPPQLAEEKIQKSDGHDWLVGSSEVYIYTVFRELPSNDWGGDGRRGRGIPA